jgi:hypothetical protein
MNKWMSARDACDLCKADISAAPFVDGQVRGHTSWALMCVACFEVNGAGIGPGVGQLYDINGLKVIAATTVAPQLCAVCGEDNVPIGTTCPVCRGIVH